MSNCESAAAAHDRVSGEALDRIFRTARTYRVWRPEGVPEAILKEVYELTALGPTSANSLPARFVFLTTPEAKERLLPALAPGNVEKTRTAPVTAIVAYDSQFLEAIRQLLKDPNALSWLDGNPAAIEETAFRNGTLQGGYFMLAARALGLDCGPMSGFDPEKVNREFFPDGRWKVNFLCNLGYGDGSKMPPRAPRLGFAEACRVL
ncbi:MAG TPA: malonic semialdehyde reductase [Bryobacteraceae bacterium]|nr:malonic semialdehyde reductase [Bryobacteraceae bacterium]